MLHIGLTGGLASGKSFISQELQRLGCFVIKLDELGHRALEPGADSYAQVLLAFAGKLPLVLPDGKIDRRALGAYVFQDAARLEELNAIIHPAVRAREKELAGQFFKTHPDGIAVTEAAILVETGRHREYDRLVVAACLPEQQVERAMARGMSREEAEVRMQRQLPLETKRKYAHFVIDTSGTEESTLAQTRAVVGALRSF